MNSQCRLCRRDTVLRESHIVPKFVWVWLKQTSVSGIRASANPNVRVQDGYKTHLLCHDCEQLLSRYEKPFAEQFFEPVHAGNSPSGQTYGGWALPFAVSVAWRVLVWDLEHPSAPERFSLRQREAVIRAESRWREYLLGIVPHPAEFEQHVLIFDIIEGHTTNGISPFFNRYITRSAGMDVLASRKTVMTFAKLGKILLFGHIDGPTSEWKGTKLHLRGGALQEKFLRMPAGIFEYLNEKADATKAALDGLSPKQAEKAEEAVWKSPDRVAGSLAFEAMMRDVELSGDRAFAPPKRGGA